MKPLTFPEISNFLFDINKPLIICDADQVIFDFMNTFEKHLYKNKLIFNWKSYALDGNILDDKGQAINNNQIKDIITDFFRQNTSSMELIKGAKNSLKILSKSFNIIILSNIPFEFYEKRKNALINHNLNFPFFANKGPKGVTVKFISKFFKENIWFIDDSPYQIKSVKLAMSTISTILFVNNVKLVKLSPDKEYCDYFSKNWKNNLKIILE